MAASKSDGRRGDQESDDFDWFSGGIVVSCQAREGSPLRDPYVMSAMAAAAVEAGARGIRANGATDIAAIARRIAEMHEGRLELAESRPGRTEFRVVLGLGDEGTG